MNTGATPDGLVLPKFEPIDHKTPPEMDMNWQCKVILHPFAPPPTLNPSEIEKINKETPFYQLCTALVTSVRSRTIHEFVFSAQVVSVENPENTWWYLTIGYSTKVSLDKGKTWQKTDLPWDAKYLATGVWTLGRNNATAVGKSPLNWLDTRNVEWWKMPYAQDGPTPADNEAAIWMWFHDNLPTRMMYGAGPEADRDDKTKLLGSADEWPLFQMFSFTYFDGFEVGSSVTLPENFEISSTIPMGFESGNPKNYELFSWNGNSGLTTFMSPINEKYNPLPTRVFYKWKEDGDYKVVQDRAQNTLMHYGDYNHSSEPFIKVETALMYGIAPRKMENKPVLAGTSYIIDTYSNEITDCNAICFPDGQGGQISGGAEPPDWIQIPGVQGKIKATIIGNNHMAPNNTPVTIISCLFPPSDEFPIGRYLWCWYSPLDASGRESRPITFMESAAELGAGTSLALADYFDYQIFKEEISNSYFDFPTSCAVKYHDIKNPCSASEGKESCNCKEAMLSRVLTPHSISSK
ncbi:MAG: hypothetical protein R3261_00975 [Alphaproteobacteria bacterium]|nr:hypothetical protein [Alphaproteobacteria bacterium]